jgi:hypothetical protein
MKKYEIYLPLKYNDGQESNRKNSNRYDSN